MGSPAELEQEILSAATALIDEGLLTEQFLVLVGLQDASEPNLLSELARMFFTTAKEKLAEMDRVLGGGCVGETDYPGLDDIAHKLKGSSANFGAKVLTDMCSALRDACESRQLEACRVVVERQAAALEALRGRLQPLMDLDARWREMV